jgi:TldD protein
MQPASQFFEQQYGVTSTDLENYLAAALGAGGEYADLYFEHRATTSITLDESLIKGATQGVSVGCGVRVIAGERTGYAYTDDLSSDKILQAARIAAHISSGPAHVSTVGLTELALPRSLYPVVHAPTDMELAAKLDLAWRADRCARAYDPRITHVRVSYSDEVRYVLNANSDGRIAGDFQPLTVLAVFALARDGSQVQRGFGGGGGRVELEFFLKDKPPEHFAGEAAR